MFWPTPRNSSATRECIRSHQPAAAVCLDVPEQRLCSQPQSIERGPRLKSGLGRGLPPSAPSSPDDSTHDTKTTAQGHHHPHSQAHHLHTPTCRSRGRSARRRSLSPSFSTLKQSNGAYSTTLRTLCDTTVLFSYDSRAHPRPLITTWTRSHSHREPYGEALRPRDRPRTPSRSASQEEMLSAVTCVVSGLSVLPFSLSLAPSPVGHDSSADVPLPRLSSPTFASTTMHRHAHHPQPHPRPPKARHLLRCRGEGLSTILLSSPLSLPPPPALSPALSPGTARRGHSRVAEPTTPLPEPGQC